MTTDFNSFDPNKVGQTGFNAKRQGGNNAPDHSQAQENPGHQGDPYANLKMDPSRLMDLLSAQARLNVPADVQNAGVTRNIDAFSNLFPPERYERLTRIFSQAYAEEFGQPPSEELVESLVSDYIIGRPVVA